MTRSYKVFEQFERITLIVFDDDEIVFACDKYECLSMLFKDLVLVGEISEFRQEVEFYDILDDCENGNFGNLIIDNGIVYKWPELCCGNCNREYDCKINEELKNGQRIKKSAS